MTMIRFAPQTAAQAAFPSKASPEPKPVAIPVAALELATSGVIDRTDGAMLLTELPEIAGPASAKVRKVRGERKPKADPQAETVQLALEA